MVMGRIGTSVTGNSMIPTVFGPDSAVAVAVEPGHGFLGEEGEGFLED